MLEALITVLIALTWLGHETEWLTVRLPVGKASQQEPDTIQLYQTWLEDAFPLRLVRLDWEVCKARYGTKQLQFSPGIDSPLCGWDWLENNTHPIPQVDVSFTSGGVRYHWQVKDLGILKDAISATHAKPKNGNGKLHFKKNKLGGLVAPLPAKVK